MDMPVIFSRTVSPVCLAPASTDPDLYQDQPAIIMGWDISPTQASVNPLNQGLVAVMGSGDCRADPKFGKFFTNNNMCVNGGANSATPIITCPVSQ
jgi:hypothetical protein